MFRIYEFEVWPCDGGLVAEPFGLTGSVHGADLPGVLTEAASWLREEIEWADIQGDELPEARLGNQPRHGNGLVAIVCASACKEGVERISASEAARRLSVSPSRVTHMLATGKLVGWRDGPRTWVTVRSVEDRLGETHPAGRPRCSAK